MPRSPTFAARHFSGRVRAGRIFAIEQWGNLNGWDAELKIPRYERQGASPPSG